MTEVSALPAAARAALEGELWSILREVLRQGAAIESAYAAGKYQTYEEYSAALDEGARSAVADFVDALAPRLLARGGATDERTAGKVDGLRMAADYLAGGCAVNLGGLEDQLTVQDFQEALMTAVQMFSEALRGKADEVAARAASAPAGRTAP